MWQRRIIKYIYDKKDSPIKEQSVKMYILATVLIWVLSCIQPVETGTSRLKTEHIYIIQQIPHDGIRSCFSPSQNCENHRENCTLRVASKLPNHLRWPQHHTQRHAAQFWHRHIAEVIFTRRDRGFRWMEVWALLRCHLTVSRYAIHLLRKAFSWNIRTLVSHLCFFSYPFVIFLFFFKNFLQYAKHIIVGSTCQSCAYMPNLEKRWMECVCSIAYVIYIYIYNAFNTTYTFHI